MNTVQPIRDMNTVMDIARYLKQNNERDYVMFTTGIYSGHCIKINYKKDPRQEIPDGDPFCVIAESDQRKFFVSG